MGISSSLINWLKTAGIASVGGGIAGAVTAAMDPRKYHFPHDVGSGKLWDYFFMGAGLTFGGLLLKSPLGQRVIATYQESQQLLTQSKSDIDQAKASLTAAAQALPEKPPPPQTVAKKTDG